MELWIATPFRRPKAPVSLKNANGSRTEYFFKPCDPANENSEHVALVKDRDHVSRLLSLDGGKAYTIAEYQGDGKTAASSDMRPQSTSETLATASKTVADVGAALAAGATSAMSAAISAAGSAPAPTDEAGASDGGMIEGTGPRPNEPQIQPQSARDAQAVTLLAMPLRDFKAAMTKTPLLVAGAALLIEDGKNEADKRPTYIKALNDRLKKG